MRIRVTNTQQYAVARGGHVFPPGVTTEVSVSSAMRLTEITACVYLKVTPVDQEPAAPVVPPAALVDQPGGGTIDPDAMTKDELLAIAEAAGAEVNPRMTKAQIADAIGAVTTPAEIETESGELPPFAEWELSGLQQLADEWELEVPADADHATLVAAIEAEVERRATIDAPALEPETSE